jgi:transcriptional regulator of met regulon
MTRSTSNDVKRVTVSLPRRQIDVLAAIATREDVSLAWLVRKAVDRFLRDGSEIRVANPPKPSKGLK